MIHKIIDIENLYIPSINQKYGVGRNRKLFLTEEYKNFKKVIMYYCKKIKLTPPYRIIIGIKTYNDIDNSLKVIIDGIRKSLSDDRDVLQLHVYKIRKKRGQLNSLIVFVEEIKEDEPLPEILKGWNNVQDKKEI